MGELVMGFPYLARHGIAQIRKRDRIFWVVWRRMSTTTKLEAP